MLKCKKAHSEEAYDTRCPVSIREGKPALVFKKTSEGWTIWCGSSDQVFCARGNFTWLLADTPSPLDDRHYNNGTEQWAFYPENTKKVAFSYTCTQTK